MNLKKIFLFCLCLIILFGATCQATNNLSSKLESLAKGLVNKLEIKNENYKLAVTELVSADQKRTKLSIYIAKKLTISLPKKRDKVTIVSRDRLKQVLKEQEFNTSGLVDQDTAQKFGKILGANGVILGTYFSFEDKIELMAKIIDVETGEVRVGNSVQITKNKFIEQMIKQELSPSTKNKSKSPNLAPKLNQISNKEVKAGQILTFNLNAFDPERDQIIYQATDLPTEATLNPTTGKFEWQPTVSDIGIHKINFKAIARNKNDQQQIKIKVTTPKKPISLEITDKKIKKLKTTIKVTITPSSNIQQATINWGDNNTDIINSGFPTLNLTHTYNSSGTYNILITAKNKLGKNNKQEFDITLTDNGLNRQNNTIIKLSALEISSSQLFLKSEFENFIIEKLSVEGGLGVYYSWEQYTENNTYGFLTKLGSRFYLYQGEENMTGVYINPSVSLDYFIPDAPHGVTFITPTARLGTQVNIVSSLYLDLGIEGKINFPFGAGGPRRSLAQEGIGEKDDNPLSIEFYLNFGW